MRGCAVHRRGGRGNGQSGRWPEGCIEGAATLKHCVDVRGSAYQALLKLQAREISVSRGKGKGSGKGQQDRQRDWIS